MGDVIPLKPVAATESEPVAPAPSSESLLAPEMTARLARLRLVARRVPSARRRGARRTRRAGHGVEPIDTREYTPGDDPRRIAWSAYGKLERLLVWLVADTQPLRLGVVIDASASMRAGTPSKLTIAKQIAAGMAAVAIGAEDRVAAVAVRDRAALALRARNGRRGLSQLLAFLDTVAPEGTTKLKSAIDPIEGALGGRGLVLLVSDLFDPDGALEAARGFRLRGHQVALIEVLDRAELDPEDLSGLTLEDDETGELVDLPLDSLAAYQRELAAHREAIDRGASELGAHVVRATTSDDFESIVTSALGTGLLARGGTT